MLLLCSLVAAAAALAPHAAVVRALLERAEVDVHLLEQAEEIYYVRRAAQKIVGFFVLLNGTMPVLWRF